MQVSNHPSLYRLGSILYFRRSVPADARAAFGGKREVIVSLKTGSLAEAKPKWAELFSQFEATLAKARSPQVERIIEPPTPEVIDEAVGCSVFAASFKRRSSGFRKSSILWSWTASTGVP